MRKHGLLETDSLEDERELRDVGLRKQIAHGYKAYLCGETKDLDKLIAELQNNLSGKAMQLENPSGRELT
jgi:hypothetical protein